MVEELRFGDRVDSLERSREPDQLGGQGPLSAQFGQLRHENRLLALAAKPAGDSSPEYILLKLDAFAGIRESVRVQLPKFIDPGSVPLRAESRPKKKAGKNQPGFLVFD